LFLVVWAIFVVVLLLLLLLCEIFTQHLLPLHCAMGFIFVVSMFVVVFMFHCTIFMGFVQLQLLVHHVCLYITIVPTLLILVHHKCSYITIVPTSQMSLHHNCSCIIDFFMSQMFLHCSCSYIVDFFTTWNLFFFGATCVISNFYVFVFFAGF
jgi:hypothetical protein